MENLCVYFYDEGHMKETAALFYRVFTAPPWEYSWFTREKIYAYFQDLAACPKFLGFVLVDNENNNKIIGACLGSIFDYFNSSQYDIKEIFLQTDLQKKGLGSLFLQTIENELKKRNVDLTALYTQRAIDAYDFYLKNGYDVVPDTVFMTKFL